MGKLEEQWFHQPMSKYNLPSKSTNQTTTTEQGQASDWQWEEPSVWGVCVQLRRAGLLTQHDGTGGTSSDTSSACIPWLQLPGARTEDLADVSTLQSHPQRWRGETWWSRCEMLCRQGVWVLKVREVEAGWERQDKFGRWGRVWQGSEAQQQKLGKVKQVRHGSDELG